MFCCQTFASNQGHFPRVQFLVGRYSSRQASSEIFPSILISNQLLVFNDGLDLSIALRCIARAVIDAVRRGTLLQATRPTAELSQRIDLHSAWTIHGAERG